MSIYVNGTKNLPTDEYTKLLLHCDGTDNGTTFTDETGKNIIRGGGVCTRVAQKKFGTASAYFDGSGDFIYFDSSTDFSPGAGAFTIDGWFMVSAFSNYQSIFDMRTADTDDVNSLSLATYWTSATPKPYLYGGGNGPSYASNSLFLNTWYHFAVVGNGGADGSRNIKVYFNGELAITKTCNYNLNKGYFVIGSNGLRNGGYFNGYQDEIRFNKGIQRWTSNFTPPSSAYEWSASTPTNANYEVTSVTRSFSGVNRNIKQIDRSYSGVNRLVFGGEPYLYNMGDECVSITGGWTEQVVNEVGSSNNTTFTKNLSDMTIAAIGVDNVSNFKGGITNNQIDLTGFTSLSCKVTNSNKGSGTIDNQSFLIIACPSNGTLSGMTVIIKNNTTGYQELTADISALNGSYYIWACVHVGGSTSYKLTSVITEVKLT